MPEISSRPMGAEKGPMRENKLSSFDIEIFPEKVGG
jgi:hypothetical protein